MKLFLLIVGCFFPCLRLQMITQSCMLQILRCGLVSLRGAALLFFHTAKLPGQTAGDGKIPGFQKLYVFRTAVRLYIRLSLSRIRFIDMLFFL